MRSLFSQILFPEEACLLCAVHPATADGPCAACVRDLPWLLRACTGCGMPLPPDLDACACDPADWPFSGVLCALAFEFPADRLVKRFKERPDLRLSLPLARLLHRRIRQAGRPRPALLVPVPAAPERLAVRGFDQAVELSRELSRLSGIPFRSDIIRRAAGGSAQKSLSRQQRERNLADLFSLAPDIRLPARIALVDDVVTTGATARHLAALLRARGATDIQVWGVARTL